jgi:hypothetical protein
MMPPRYLRRSSLTRLKPCAEFTVEACDSIPSEQCCGTMPCKLCLEWEGYGEDVQYGSAEFATSSWTGLVGDLSFVSYWERNYSTDECEYVVTLDGEEVYRATCYEGASCRNPQGDIQVSTPYLEGTLRWGVYEPRELALITDPDTGCRDFFCGTCRCSCECLCVTITEYGGNVITGEICDTAYDCDPPVWAGTIGYYEVSVALGRDQYGNCTIALTLDGEEQDPVEASGCANMSASVTLGDGTTISVRCKQCSCEEAVDDSTCCVGRCYPGVGADPPTCTGAASDNPQPASLTVEMTTDDATYGCFSGSVVIPLAGNGRWGTGKLTATCMWHDPSNSTNPFVTWYFTIIIAVQCTPRDGWGIEFRRDFFEPTPSPSFIPTDSLITRNSCDPILLEGTVCFTPGMSSVVFPAIPPMPPLQHPDICLSFLVYETP